ncbi:APC family permease [Pseudarthrobacter albicanus]|uniref:APC family permease n=1 Tax=Pseudarthrobacter albicanus TaxID=2823873 RepID=UPI001FE60116|nr:APC family permease [Pseudarthrobacter albicanus]
MSSTQMQTKKPRRKLPLWAALALSLATVGPTLAMAGNGQGLIGIVGKSIPLVFLIGLIGVSLVGYGFVRLTRHLNHAGSAYALVGGTIGPRAGFFSGFAMLGAYTGFSIGTLALTGAFVNAFLAQLQSGSADPFQIPWPITITVGAAVSFLLAGREVSLIAKILLVIEGVGIIAMVILVCVIFAKGGAPATGVDMSVFSFEDVNVTQVMSGVVAAFLSWAGFEACASLGEETDNPKRNVPRALGGTLVLTGVLFIVVMFAQTIGFGTDPAGLARMQTSGNTLGDLGHDYIGTGFSLIVIFTAVCAAFGCHVATAATAGRMIYAFARDGFGPSALAVLHARTNGPRRATMLVVALALVAGLACAWTGWPVMGTNNPAIDTYFLFAVAGAVCLMVAYFMVEIAAMWFTGHRKFDAVHGGHGRFLGVALPALGALFIAVVLWFNVKDAGTPVDAPLLGLYWCVLGLVLAVAASRIAAKVGAALTTELDLPVLGKKLDPLAEARS